MGHTNDYVKSYEGRLVIQTIDNRDLYDSKGSFENNRRQKLFEIGRGVSKIPSYIIYSYI